jgi:hypothetical protein
MGRRMGCCTPAGASSVCYNGQMKGFLALFLLPALFLVASIWVLRLADARDAILLYFLAAVLLGMGIAAYMRAWKRPPKD